MGIIKNMKQAGESLITKVKKPVLVAGAVLALSGALQSCENITPEEKYRGTEQEKIEAIKAKDRFDSSYQTILTLSGNDLNRGPITVQGVQNDLTNEVFVIRRDPSSLGGVLISRIVNGEELVSYFVAVGRVEQETFHGPKGEIVNVIKDAKEAKKIYDDLNWAMRNAMKNTH